MSDEGYVTEKQQEGTGLEESFHFGLGMVTGALTFQPWWWQGQFPKGLEAEFLAQR